MPQISVIVPVYNAERFLERCIKSVQEQTLSDWELILVNDASTDGSIAIIKAFAEKDPRIKWYDNKVNQGPMVVRQQGVMEATGEYVTFLDSDDEYPSNALELFLGTATQSDADIVSGYFMAVQSNGMGNIIKSYLQYGNDMISVYKSLLRFEFLPNLCNKLFKRELFVNNSLDIFDQMRRGEDALVLYQIIRFCTKVIQINHIVYHYILNDDSSSHKTYSFTDFDLFLQANAKKVELLGKYEDIEIDLYRHISKNLNAFFAQGYLRDSILLSLIRKHKLERYVRIKEMCHYFSLPELIEITTKKYIFPLLGRKFDGWKFC